MTQDKTKLATLGRNEHPAAYPSVSVPVYRASTLTFPTLEEFEKADAGDHEQPCYGIYGSPTTFALAKAIAELEEADGTLLTSSGLEAISLTLMAFTEQGSHILVSDSVYGPTRAFCDNELKRFGVETTYFDPEADGATIAPLIRDNTTLIFLESPGSLTFEMQDIIGISEAAKAINPEIVIVGDNTWATPLYFKPFDHGIDISIHALTKYIGGHSDLLMGSISAKNAHIPRLKAICKSFGARITGDEAYLALRGLRSMAVRLEQHERSAREICVWLESRPEVKEIFYPALPHSRGHARWKAHMTGACGLFAIEIEKTDQKALAAFLDGLKLFAMGFSWGGFESLIIPYAPAPMRTASRDKWKDKQLLRLNIGLEDPADLIADLDAGFTRMANVQ